MKIYENGVLSYHPKKPDRILLPWRIFDNITRLYPGYMTSEISVILSHITNPVNKSIVKFILDNGPPHRQLCPNQLIGHHPPLHGIIPLFIPLFYSVLQYLNSLIITKLSMKNFKMTSISLVVILTSALHQHQCSWQVPTKYFQTHKKHYKNI